MSIMFSKRVLPSGVGADAGEVAAELSVKLDTEETELTDMLFCLARAFLVRLSLVASSGFFLGLPRLACLLTTPSKAPMHIPRWRCLVSASCRAKSLPQGQTYGFDDEWIFLWRFRSCDLTKHLLHSSHWN